MKFLLINLPESITYFAFLVVMFYAVLNERYTFVKLATMFVSVFVVMSAVDYITDEAISGIFIIFILAFVWSLLFGFKWFLKALLTVFICSLATLIIQAWIPLYLLSNNLDTSIFNNIMTEFKFSIPCRIIEYILIILIGLRSKKLIADSVSRIAKSSASIASQWWVYQPKVPKKLR